MAVTLSKIGTENGTLASGNMDQQLWFISWWFNFDPYPCEKCPRGTPDLCLAEHSEVDKNHQHMPCVKEYDRGILALLGDAPRCLFVCLLGFVYLFISLFV